MDKLDAKSAPHFQVLGLPPRIAAAASAIAGLALFPLALIKPGRILTNELGGIIVNPISLRGFSLLLAADIAFVISVHLLRTLLVPQRSHLPVNSALMSLVACGVMVGGLGWWLLEAPWQPEPDSGVVVPPPTQVDLLGFALAGMALGAHLCFRTRYAWHWRITAPSRRPLEREQSLPRRMYRGFFMGLILGTILGTITALLAVAAAHGLGSPLQNRIYFIVGFGAPVSLFTQVWMLDCGLRGQITEGNRMPWGR